MFVNILTAPGSLIIWKPKVSQEMDQDDSQNWEKANWSNGSVFNNTWQPDNVSFNNGIMTLTLDNEGCPKTCDGKPYASGEYRTRTEEYRYGYYEARMKAAKGNGLVAGTFFVYSGVYGEKSHNEIDFEVLGNDPTKVQLNHYYAGHGKDQAYKRMVDLGFDATKGFHNYGFLWKPDSITWYVDGKPVHTATKDIPQGKTKIMVNFWPGINVGDWLGGNLQYGQPMHVKYDWIRHSPLAGEQPKTETPAPALTPKPESTAPVNPLSIASIQQGSFAFNAGSVSQSAGIYKFSAKEARDPGFGIHTGNADLGGRNKLKFEIKGNFQKLGGYARFIAQVYSASDNDYSPSIQLDPVNLSGNWTEVTVNLEGKIPKSKKVQFLLVTDKGSCEVEIRNLRFE